MARRARMIVPGLPNRVTQHGNRRERIFLQRGDEAVYLDLLAPSRAAATSPAGPIA